MLPNFIVIGAVKAGTTALYRYLIQHPEIFMPPNVKEPRYFCFHPQFPMPGLKIPITTLDEYRALFDGAGTEKAIGEASPHYLPYPNAAESIAALLPNVKLIVSLRNPVARSHSEYLMAIRNSGKAASSCFTDVLEGDPKLISSSQYDVQLERYYARFPREQIKVIVFEQFIKDPISTLRSIFEFLEVDPDFVPDVSQNPNPGGVPRNHTLYLILRQLTHSKRLSPLRNKAPAPIHTAMKYLKRSVNMKPVKLTQDELFTALPLFSESIRNTELLIGQDLSAWLNPE